MTLKILLIIGILIVLSNQVYSDSFIGNNSNYTLVVEEGVGSPYIAPNSSNPFYILYVGNLYQYILTPKQIAEIILGGTQFTRPTDNLGIFQRGDFINFVYQYLNVNRSVETNPTDTSYMILYPNTSIAKISDMLPLIPMSGLFYSNYSVPNEAPFGEYTIRINGTVGGANNTAGLLFFKVQEPNENSFYWIALVIGLVVFLIGVITRDKFVSIIAGFIIVIIGIYNSSKGFYRFSNPLIDTGFLVVILGIGFYLIVKNGYDLIMESW